MAETFNGSMVVLGEDHDAADTPSLDLVGLPIIRAGEKITLSRELFVDAFHRPAEAEVFAPLTTPHDPATVVLTNRRLAYTWLSHRSELPSSSSGGAGFIADAADQATRKVQPASQVQTQWITQISWQHRKEGALRKRTIGEVLLRFASRHTSYCLALRPEDPADTEGIAMTVATTVAGDRLRRRGAVDGVLGSEEARALEAVASERGWQRSATGEITCRLPGAMFVPQDYAGNDLAG